MQNMKLVAVGIFSLGFGLLVTTDERLEIAM
jgi:hypothetical protein